MTSCSPSSENTVERSALWIATSRIAALLRLVRTLRRTQNVQKVAAAHETSVANARTSESRLSMLSKEVQAVAMTVGAEDVYVIEAAPEEPSYVSTLRGAPRCRGRRYVLRSDGVVL